MKPLYPMSTILAAIEYRKTHTAKDTAEQFGTSPSSVNHWCRVYGKDLGFIPKPRQPRKDFDESWKPAVRVLTEVPPGFEAPRKGFGW